MPYAIALSNEGSSLMRFAKIVLCILSIMRAQKRIVIAASLVRDSKGHVPRNTRIVIEGSEIVAIDLLETGSVRSTFEKPSWRCAELFSEHRNEGAGAAVPGFQSCSGNLLTRGENLHRMKQAQLLPPPAESHLRFSNKEALDCPFACAALLAESLQCSLLSRVSHERVSDSPRSRV